MRYGFFFSRPIFSISASPEAGSWQACLFYIRQFGQEEKPPLEFRPPGMLKTVAA